MGPVQSGLLLQAGARLKPNMAIKPTKRMVRLLIKPASFQQQTLGQVNRLSTYPSFSPDSPFAYSSCRDLGSRSLVVNVVGTVTNGPPSIGARRLKATSGMSLARPASGKSLRSG